MKENIKTELDEVVEQLLLPELLILLSFAKSLLNREGKTTKKKE
ncbi:hypothetical protein [Anaerosalibacter sp. Marseille-P3206]|nr:hypothetical protein [Anaerosalibacter sp. Marseille-P3206]